MAKKKARLAGVGWLAKEKSREYPEPTPNLRVQYRDLNLDYLRLLDETQAAMRRLLQFEAEHPELFPRHRS